MTATTLLNQFPEAKITLVESPNTPTIGVGESTVAGSQSGFNGIVEWLKLVGIQDSDWMPHCDAIHKLSIAFKDWYRKDSGTFHFPFGEPRITENNFGLKDWHIKKIFYFKFKSGAWNTYVPVTSKGHILCRWDFQLNSSTLVAAE